MEHPRPQDIPFDQEWDDRVTAEWKDWTGDLVAEEEAKAAAAKEKKKRRRSQYRANCKARGKSLKKKSNWQLAQEALQGADDSGFGNIEEIEEFLRPFFGQASLDEFVVERPPREENWEPALEAYARKMAKIKAEAARKEAEKVAASPSKINAVSNDVNKTCEFYPLSPAHSDNGQAVDFVPEHVENLVPKDWLLPSFDDNSLVIPENAPPSPTGTFKDVQAYLESHRQTMAKVQATLERFRAEREAESSSKI